VNCAILSKIVAAADKISCFAVLPSVFTIVKEHLSLAELDKFALLEYHALVVAADWEAARNYDKSRISFANSSGILRLVHSLKLRLS
jgi:hypothetical protein